MGISGRHAVGEPAEGAVGQAFKTSAVGKIVEAGRLAKPYLDQGLEPPVGLHPLIDQLHADQARQDVKALDDVLSEAQSSTTRERAPDLFADFVRQCTDARIGIRRSCA